jgi:hypothetical protein
MNPALLSVAGTVIETPVAPRVVLVEGIGNAEFIETYASPGRVGLCGGVDFINKSIRKLQHYLTPEGHRSPFSHAFLFSGRRIDGRHWVLESDLDIHHKQIRLGVQENRADRYHDEESFPNLAILDFGLSAEQQAIVLSEALDLLSGLSHYSLRELLGTLMSMRHATLRRRRNLLESEGALYCSAMVQHCYAKVGIEFAAGVNHKNVAPHDIFATRYPHTAYVLIREPGRSSLRDFAERVSELFENASA